MTFKDLKKRVSLETAIQQQFRLTERLYKKPFWIWNIKEHKQEDINTKGLCCFNHIIGLLHKDSVDKPLYDYERIIFDSLIAYNGNKHLWIKKATGAKDIEAAIEKGKKYSPDAPVSPMSSKSMGIDPAWGSSAFGIVVTQWVDGVVQILHAEEYHRPDYNEMLSLVYGLMSKYNVDSVYIDGANPSFIKSLKLQIGEDPDYDKAIARYRLEGWGDDPTKDMKIVPVNFNKEHKAVLGHCKMILEDEGGRIAINPDRFDKLITSLRTAVDNDGALDKEATSYNDIFDAFRLALKFYHYEESSGKYD